MFAAFTSLIATLVAAIFGSFLNEMYKRHRDACSTAAALAGELASYRQAHDALDASLPTLLGHAEAGQPLNIPPQDAAIDVVFQAYVNKLGLLGPELAEETSYVYGQLRGFRSAMYSVSRATEGTDPAYLVAGLRVAQMFTQTARLRAEPLIQELTRLSRTSFGMDLGRRLGLSRRQPFH